VVVSHRPAPEGWDPAARLRFVNGVADAVAVAQELAGDRVVSVAAGDVGGQVLEAGLVDEVALDVVPVAFGTGKRYFGPLSTQVMLENPDDVVVGRPRPRPALRSPQTSWVLPGGVRPPLGQAARSGSRSGSISSTTSRLRLGTRARTATSAPTIDKPVAKTRPGR
jgi:hypothetical protein